MADTWNKAAESQEQNEISKLVRKTLVEKMRFAMFLVSFCHFRVITLKKLVWESVAHLNYQKKEMKPS